MAYTILTGPENEILKTSSQNVPDPLSQDIQKLIPEMFETMHRADGIGLAAPQIGISLRLAVIEIESEKLVLINPNIVAKSAETIVFEEGCLSLPGEFLPILRYEKVTVEYTDEKGVAQKLKASGLLAIAIQHELDHLDGTLIVDRYRNQSSNSLKSHVAL